MSTYFGWGKYKVIESVAASFGWSIVLRDDLRDLVFEANTGSMLNVYPSNYQGHLKWVLIKIFSILDLAPFFINLLIHMLIYNLLTHLHYAEAKCKLSSELESLNDNMFYWCMPRGHYRSNRCLITKVDYFNAHSYKQNCNILTTNQMKGFIFIFLIL